MLGNVIGPIGGGHHISFQVNGAFRGTQAEEETGGCSSFPVKERSRPFPPPRADGVKRKHITIQVYMYQETQ